MYKIVHRQLLAVKPLTAKILVQELYKNVMESNIASLFFLNTHLYICRSF